MKKIITLFVCLCLLLCGCKSEPQNTQNGKLQIITTVFPVYDWVKEISGSNAQIKLLSDNGIDLHSFEPSFSDIIEISNCDILIYIGGESDIFVEDILKDKVNKNMKTIKLLDILGEKAVTEEHDSHLHEEPPFDEHIWLSLKNSKLFVSAIENAISEADPNNKEFYKTNAQNYIEKLSSLDKEFEDEIGKAQKKILLFADRFPFRYLTNDYNIESYAAFEGCSSESEASFATITFLAKKIDEHSLKYVLTIDGRRGKVAETVIENTKSKNQQILVLDSMQSTTSADIKNGKNYLSIMESNLAVIKTALGLE